MVTLAKCEYLQIKNRLKHKTWYKFVTCVIIPSFSISLIDNGETRQSYVSPRSSHSSQLSNFNITVIYEEIMSIRKNMVEICCRTRGIIALVFISLLDCFFINYVLYTLEPYRLHTQNFISEICVFLMQLHHVGHVKIRIKSS